jgi:hypothetical protein
MVHTYVEEKCASVRQMCYSASVAVFTGVDIQY